MIRIQLLPNSDPDFRARVRDAIRRVDGVHDPEVGGAIVAASEDELRRALSWVRAQYPDVWIRRQDPIASIDGQETWYAFRDEAVGAAPLRGSRH
jgi:hypothetical protein